RNPGATGGRYGAPAQFGPFSGETVRFVDFSGVKMVKKKPTTASPSASFWVACISGVSLLAVAASAAERGTLVERVRTANDRFKDVAVALSEGYAPIPCASGIDGGAMGVHYVNAKLLGSESVDIAHPQAVMYEPAADGNMNLVAVEYIASK